MPTSPIPAALLRIIAALFQSPPPIEADINGDGQVTVADVVAVIEDLPQ
jgi:hypothetical protein